MSITWILCAVGLAVGVLMGVAMLVRPRGSHLSIGLGSVPEKSGGVGESRAFGGLLLGIHGVTLSALLGVGSAAATPMATVLAIGWLGALLGRVVSVAIDREGVPLNMRLIALDAFMTGTLLAPLLWRP